MWQALDKSVCLDLTSSTDSVKKSFDRLNTATVELQLRVQELLAEYPEDGHAAVRPPPPKHAGGQDEAAALGQVDRLLGRLCAKLPRGDEGTAPGTIFTPRAPPKEGLVAGGAGVSILAGTDKLTPLLMTDVPALRWAPPGPGPPLGVGTAPLTASAPERPSQPPGGARVGATQRLAPKVQISLDGTEAQLDPMKALQEYSDDLRSEACAELRDMQPGGKAAQVHSVLLRDAVEADSLPPAGEALWSRPRVRADDVRKARQLLATIFHSSKSSAHAWAAVVLSLAHPLAEVDFQALGNVAGLSGLGQGFSARSELTLTPASFPEQLAELQRDGSQRLTELLQKRGDEKQSTQVFRCSGEDFEAFRQRILPATYLQMLGQVLLQHASLALPALADLPERVPDWVLRSLYGQPFGSALKAAIIAALADTPSEAQGPSISGAAPQEQRDKQAARSQVQSRQPSVSRSDRGGAGGSDQLGQEVQGAGGMAAAPQTGADAVVASARTAMLRLSDVFRDVAAFESGFASMISDDALLVQSNTTTSEASAQPLSAVPSRAATGYASVVREDIARALREIRGDLQKLVFHHLTLACKACLSPDEPLVDEAVASEAWPRPGDLWATGPSLPPQRIDAASQRVLLLVAWLQGRLEDYPAAVQAILSGAMLECLSQVMDRLAAVCTSVTDFGPDPLPRMLLFHSAACCVRRRLEALPCVATAAGAPHDDHHLALAQQHGQCLVQADELVGSIHRHIIAAHMDVVRAVVLASLDRTDWGTYRPEVMRGASAGPAVRIWHSMMMRLLYTAARIATVDTAAFLVGQVLQDCVACLAHRYLEICPSAQMLREFVADVVHVVATTFVLCQPLRVQSPPQQRVEAGQHSSQGPRWLRLPHVMVSALALTARQLLIRAALLHLSGDQLEAVARNAGLVPPKLPLTWLTSQPQLPRPQEPTAAVTSPTVPPSVPPLGINSQGGGGGSLRAALPAINAHRTSLSTDSMSAAVAEGLTRAPSERPGVANEGSCTSAEGVASGAAGPGKGTTPFSATNTLGGRAPVGRRGLGGGDDGPSDEERLALWTSWLPQGIVQALLGEARALELGGEVAVTGLVPLDDRTAEAAAGGQDSGGGSAQAGGRAWLQCLVHLAKLHAKGEEVLLALARRSELYAAVGNEPAGHAEGRPFVRAMARQLGLLQETD